MKNILTNYDDSKWRKCRGTFEVYRKYRGTLEVYRNYRGIFEVHVQMYNSQTIRRRFVKRGLNN